jgi:hypothetical protein
MTATVPREGTTIAALVLGIVSVGVIYLPLLSSAAAVCAVIMGANGMAAAKAGIPVSRPMAAWGMWLGVVNLAVWGAVVLWWQLA